MEADFCEQRVRGHAPADVQQPAGAASTFPNTSEQGLVVDVEEHAFPSSAPVPHCVAHTEHEGLAFERVDHAVPPPLRARSDLPAHRVAELAGGWLDRATP
jgi:hypothetical protein